MKKPSFHNGVCGLALLFVLISSCKKNMQIPVCCALNAHPILFEVLDKSGNNIVHSVNDQLLLTYVADGLTVTNQLDIFKAQKSATDTTMISKYNGFVLSDANPSVTGAQGYMSSNSSNSVVHNFTIYLNGQLVGAVFFDYWAAANTFTTSPNPNFTLNGIAATSSDINAILRPGYPANLGYALVPYTGTVGDMNVYLLNLQ